MKEIKAYVRRSCVNKAVEELQKAGSPGITIAEIHPVGYGYEPKYYEESFDDELQRYRDLGMVKIEVVCADEDLERLLTVIQATCKTGAKGDGWIFVGDISLAIRIRDAARDASALKSSGWH
jgi:nitrogen regulatory protein P-II 1